MVEELSIISSNLLTNVSETEVNALIEQMVEKSKSNMEEICELTFECTTLLSSAESRSVALSNQGVFKRLIGSITGKNQKLQNAILQDNTNVAIVAHEKDTKEEVMKWYEEIKNDKDRFLSNGENPSE